MTEAEKIARELTAAQREVVKCLRDGESIPFSVIAQRLGQLNIWPQAVTGLVKRRVLYSEVRRYPYPISSRRNCYGLTFITGLAVKRVLEGKEE